MWQSRSQIGMRMPSFCPVERGEELVLKTLFIRSSFDVYGRQYLEHNKNEKQSEYLFPLFQVYITRGFKSEVSEIFFLLENIHIRAEISTNIFCSVYFTH